MIIWKILCKIWPMIFLSAPKGSDDESQAYMNKTLEEFYVQADSMFTPRQSRPSTAKVERIKSAPPKVSCRNPPKLGHQLEETSRYVYCREKSFSFS